LSLYGSEATVTVRQSVTVTRDGRTQSAEGTSIDKWVRQDSGWKLKESLESSTELKESPTDPETSKQVAAELRRRAVPLTTAEAGNPYQDLVAFGKAVGDARVVALGEATHGTREIFQMKHRLLEYLVREKGFTVFAIEANWPESIAADRYIKTGEGDPRKALAGMYFWTWQTEEVLAMVEWMRAYNQAAGSRPLVSFTSFDMQTYTVALERVSDYIKKYGPTDASAVEASYKALRVLAAGTERNDPRFTDALVQALSVVKLLLLRWQALTRASGEAAFREALQAARIVSQAIRLKSPGAGADYRDQMMAANVEWLANEAFRKEKIVLWAHNGHVTVDRSVSGRPMGNWLREALGDRLYVLGFAIHKGDVRAMALENGRMSGLTNSPVPAAPAGTGTAMLSAVGLPIFFADLKSLAAGGGTLGSWLGQPHLFRECGAVWSRDGAANANMVSTVLSSSYDGLIFLEDTRAARGLP
jgi:erythromycin esterase